MYILSDVKISGSLETVGNVRVGNIGSGVIEVSRIKCTGGTVRICANYSYTNSISTNYVSFEKSLYASNGASAIFCNVSFGNGEKPSILDLTNAKVIGLEIPTKTTYNMMIPPNCSVFSIDTCSSCVQYKHTKRVPVSSFMQDGLYWKQVQLDISFKQINSGTEMYALIGSLSQAFSEAKTMEFIVG